MCDICRCSPCAVRCPNYEPEFAFECDICGAKIYVGEDYYKIEENKYCEECVENAREQADADEY